MLYSVINSSVFENSVAMYENFTIYRIIFEVFDLFIQKYVATTVQYLRLN